LDYRVVDLPDASTTPVSPNARLIYLSSIVAALILGAGYVLLKELLNKKIALRNDIESFTTLPIVGEIPFRKIKESQLLTNEEDGILADQFQRLRTSFHYLGLDSTKKRILITSTISGEGKSFTASHLSLTIAGSGKKVVLLEADLSNPSLFQKFGNKEVHGITNYLHGEVEAGQILKQTEYQNLSIIPAGKPTTNSAALLVNGRMENLLEFLEKKFDYIIIDSAPVGLLTDAYILSPSCDATLYVVRQNYSPKDFVQKIIDENKRFNKLKNIAIVFNGIQSNNFSLDKYGYGYGYGNNNKRANNKWALKKG
jgi:capsular exopolysaccharide synthesis family protein